MNKINFNYIFLLLYSFSTIVFSETITIINTPLNINGIAGTPSKNIITKDTGEYLKIIIKPKKEVRGAIKINGTTKYIGDINTPIKYTHKVTSNVTIETFYTIVNDISYNSNVKLSGNLINSSVSMFSASNLSIPIATSKTNDNGQFSLNDSQLSNDNDYYLISVTSGTDSDTGNSHEGYVYGIVSGRNIKKGNLNVSVISDIAWRYIEKNINELSNNDIKTRLIDIAKILFKNDITGDGIIDEVDLIYFDPENINHKNNLNFNYQILYDSDIENDSIINTHYSNKVEKLELLLEEKFGNRLSLYTTKDSRTNEVKIEVISFGKGELFSDDGNIYYDNEKENSENKIFSFYKKNDSSITIIAKPKVDTEILSWNGCNIVSSDKSQCQVSLLSSHQVSISFGYKETQVINNLIDLSYANVTLEGEGTIYVTVNHGDDELVTKMSNLVVNDYVVGSTDNGFLRKVSSVTKISDFKYNIESVDATLDEVIKQGTGTFSKVMTNEDINSNLISQARITSNSYNLAKKNLATPGSPIGILKKDSTVFSEIEGVELIRSNNPKDTSFTIKIGNSNSISEAEPLKQILSVEGIGIKDREPTLLYSKNGVDVKAIGEITVDFKLDIGASYGLFSGLEYFKVIPQINATEKVEFFIGGDVKLPEKKVRLGRIPFQRMVFFIGVVPVYIQSNLEVFLGFDGKVTAKVNTGFEFKQQIRFGVVYNKDTDINVIGEFNPSWDFIEPKAEVSYEMRGFIEPKISVMLYGVIGPAVLFNGYLKLKTNLIDFDTNTDTWKNNSCVGGFNNTAWIGIKSNFEWNIIGADTSKFGKIISKNLNGLSEKQIFNKEWLISHWQVGGICDETKTPPKLKLIGEHIYEAATAFSTENIVKTFVISNVGGIDLNWQLQYIEDNIFSVSKKSGTLSPNTDEIITVTLDPSILDVGEYHNKLEFINNYDFGLISDDNSGSTEKDVSLKLVPDNISAPSNFNAELFKPTIAKLTWNYPSSEQFIDLIKGYRIFQSTDQVNWESIVVLNDVNIKSYLVSNLLTDRTYYFKIDAYTDDVESLTVEASIYIPKIEPEGDCRAHFSGILMGDNFSSGWLSEVYVEDQYSEFVGAGLYPNNQQAFPKAVSSTFDGIAIDAGTKVTIYAGANFEGEILYEKIGPATINNVKWESYSQASNVMENWKEPLQTNYPQSVREWSESNMHDWSYGSLMVECGF